MSALDEWGTFETPCPVCGGPVEWFSFALDCRGNESSSGINCTGCNLSFTGKEWENIEKKAREAKKTKAAE